MLAEKVGGGEFWHGSHAGDGVDFAILGTDQNGRFSAEAEMGKLRHVRREQGRDARIHGIAAAEEHAHAGLG